VTTVFGGRGAAGLLLLLMSTALTASGALANDVPRQFAAGRVVYDHWCAACHDPGITHPGTHALMVKYPGGQRATGVITEWHDLPASYVSYMVRHGMSVMPQFRKTEITDAELAALAAYLSRNTSQK
jgi:(+)-pinoresinol hydroxylase